jgi:hypothetical protein
VLVITLIAIAVALFLAFVLGEHVDGAGAD